ncbi:ABC transporter ATP-binding protein [Afifella sp. IM 167]|uniref:ABC transporter ATP-binding protein n=1 Tax=Afifella sp. IM 167 TaxID=2033586 RepID=UPI001CCABB3A|nr:ABC transporter ATP-binding protein [Afifella sp. IM 167]MBZ8132121.1 branched-chain amino acid ABC transporter ATP-binding protein [Afifella sp. IM 167]
MTPVLETIDLSRRFGGLTATDHVSFSLERGARHALIGPNGAGKTTFINLLTGALRPSGGQIRLAGEDVTRLAPDRRVKRGLSRTFQINQLFPEMTPLQALALAAAEARGTGAAWFSSIAADEPALARAAELLDRFGLAEFMDEPTSRLPYGRQRLLEIALSLAGHPEVLLLDEPAAGVPEEERADILKIVAALPEEVTILLIEHDMDLVFSFAERITVMVNGAIFAAGTPAEIEADRRVREVYLGEGGDE